VHLKADCRPVLSLYSDFSVHASAVLSYVCVDFSLVVLCSGLGPTRGLLEAWTIETPLGPGSGAARNFV